MEYTKNRYLTALILFCLGLSVSAASYAQDSFIFHIVQKGETLYSISNRYGMSIKEIKRLNPEISDTLKVDEKLKISNTKSAPLSRHHTIQPGETLYRISQLYNIPIEYLRNANPGLSAEKFKSGTTIIIPVASPKPAHTDKNASIQELYQVKSGDTFYGIAHKFGLTTSQLAEANPNANAAQYKLNEGDFIRIPRPYRTDLKDNTSSKDEMSHTNGKKDIKAAIVFPFSTKRANIRKEVVNYYRGILLGVSLFKEQGISFNVYTFSSEDLLQTLNSQILKTSDVIFGPYYSEQIPKLSLLAEKHFIPMFIPGRYESRAVAQKSFSFFAEPEESVATEMSAQTYLQYLSGANTLFLPPKTQDGRNFFSNLSSKINERKGSWNFIANITPSSLKEKMKKSKRNILIADAATASEAKTLIKQIKALGALGAEYQISVYVPSSWLRFGESVINELHEISAYVPIPLLRTWTNTEFMHIRNLCRASFGTDISTADILKIMQGYDAAVYMFGQLVTYGRNPVNVNRVSFMGKPFDAKFRKTGNANSFYNQNLSLVHLDSGHAIKIVN